MGAPLAVSQSSRELSSSPVTIRLPSGLKATAVVKPLCPLSNLSLGCPVVASQSLTL